MEFHHALGVGRSPTEVFAALMDLQLHPGPHTIEMEKIPPGPTTVGTTWREEVRAIGRTTLWWRVTDVVPGHRVELALEGPGVNGKLAYLVVPAGPETVIHLAARFETGHRSLGDRAGKKVWVDQIERAGAIKEAVEAAPPPRVRHRTFVGR